MTPAAKLVKNRKGEEVLRTTKRLVSSRFEGTLVCELTSDSIKLRKQGQRTTFEITAGQLYLRLAADAVELKRKLKAKARKGRRR